MADAEAVRLIHDDKVKEFNSLVERQGGVVDLSGALLRSEDLQLYNLKKANLSGAYLRAADLRGLDLSEANLEGASLKDAKISGVLFPKNLAPDEIQLSVTHGTRLRSRTT